MKKLYIPNEIDLIIIQTLGGNKSLYKYILSKVIERLLNEEKAIQDYNELCEIEELVFAWCYFHPEQIPNFPFLMSNQELALRLLGKGLEYPFSEFKYLDNFDLSIRNNQVTINRVIELLSEHLSSNPMYRFDYPQCDILDAIFTIDSSRFIECSETTKDELMNIDPIYFIRFVPGATRTRMNNKRFIAKVSSYSERYGINPIVKIEYPTSDIMKRPKVKRLINFMNKQR